MSSWDGMSGDYDSVTIHLLVWREYVHSRMRLPDFLIIGGMRCGSTSLYELLRYRHRHQVFMPPVKELHFFDKRNPDLGASVEKYAALFKGAPAAARCGEVTPDYLTTKGCDEFIKQVVPNVKLVLILRDPVARTWSHYQFSRLHRVETEDIRTALDLEAERLKLQSDRTDIFFSYLERSRYIQHLQRFAQRFGREQICVVFLEELKSDTAGTLKQLIRFIDCGDADASHSSFPHTNRINDLYRARALEAYLADSPGVLQRILRRLHRPTVREYMHLSDPDRDYLKQYFQSYDTELERWLGRPLPWTRSD